MKKRLIELIEKVETTIYGIAAVFLVAASFVILGYTVWDFGVTLQDGSIEAALVSLLEHILLAFMTVELLYTVVVSLRTHELKAEPFLIVGLVAAMRRILALSVEAATLLHESPERFTLALYELSVLIVAVLVLVISIHVLRRSCREKVG